MDKPNPFLKGENKQGFKSFISDWWTWLDLTNYALFVYFILIRISLINMIMHPDNFVKGAVLLPLCASVI
jgi:hypothetical protein